MPLFSLLLSVVFFYVWWGDMRNAWRIRGSFVKSHVFQFSIKAILLLVVSYSLVNYVITPYNGDRQALLFVFSILLSAAISYVWVTYLRWIDFFEPERKRFLFLAFGLSCITIWLVFPISDVFKSIGMHLDGSPLNDFVYSTVVIGMVEEFVKLLPLLAIIWFTNQINEPLDYIVYAGMSALGFAFIENILYLNSTELGALGARLLYASVAHMFFASCVAYPLAMNRIKTGKRFSLKWLLIGFLLASLAHGFYDFWLITVTWRFTLLTTVFFLGSLHVFTLMKNNLLNLSDFYNEHIRMNRSKLKYDLTLYILLVIYGGYVLYAILFGSTRANSLLVSTAIYHVSVIVYLALTFSSYNILRGYRIPLRFPIKVFLPKVDGAINHLGTRISLQQLEIKPFKKLAISGDLMNGKLVKRVVLNDDMNWYVFADADGSYLLIRPKELSKGFTKDRPSRVMIFPLKRPFDTNKLIYSKTDLLKFKMGFATLT